MAYDYPYRLIKTVNVHTHEVVYVIHSRDGIICEGPDHYEMRKLIDAANEMAEAAIYTSSR